MLVAVVLVALMAEALKDIGQNQVAAFLPFIALGMPARYWRFADLRTTSPYSRLALASERAGHGADRLGGGLARGGDGAGFQRARMDRLFHHALVAARAARPQGGAQ